MALSSKRDLLNGDARLPLLDERRQIGFGRRDTRQLTVQGIAQGVETVIVQLDGFFGGIPLFWRLRPLRRGGVAIRAELGDGMGAALRRDVESACAIAAQRERRRDRLDASPDAACAL